MYVKVLITLAETKQEQGSKWKAFLCDRDVCWLHKFTRQGVPGVLSASSSSAPTSAAASRHRSPRRLPSVPPANRHAGRGQGQW